MLLRFKGSAWLKNFFRFELGSGLAQLEVHNISWAGAGARARNENLSMSQARAWLELKKLGFVISAASPITKNNGYA